MRFVVAVLLMLGSGARASVILPAEVVADVPAAAWPAATPVVVAEGGAFVMPAATSSAAVDTAILPLSVVPDATSWSLLLLGMAVVGLAARRRQRSVAA